MRLVVRRPPRSRLVALDVARCLALLGMVATHVLDARDVDGSLSLSQAVAGGRAAALFAVLAGVTMALGTGGRTPVRGRERAARSAGFVVRALAIGALGLLVGPWDTGVAVILTYYGLLFLLGLVFVGLRARSLLALAVAWAVVVPVVSHLVRPSLPNRAYGNPTAAQLDAPERLFSELLLTGYYPVLPWLAYLLLGLALGRADLRSRRVAAAALLGGGAAAGLATVASRILAPVDLQERAAIGTFGVTPTEGHWSWLLVVGPHTATPFDLVQTGGSAAAVIGLALLVVGTLGDTARHAAALVFGAGTATLTLYVVHLALRRPDVPPAEEPDSFGAHVAALLGIGAVLAALRLRGPLEWLVARASRGAAALVRRR